MCGVAGIYTLDRLLGPSDLEDIQSIVQHLSHRGPDHQRVSTVSDRCILGNTRLAITDHLNPLAHMPLQSSDGSLHLVFNGEIYNHKELRLRLESYPFQTKSDSEVILAAYRKWGISCLEYLEGMFAFAIYDCTHERLFAAVDPFSQKPLYYRSDSAGVIFSSELPALLALKSRRSTWNTLAMAEMIAHRWALAPDTHIKEIKRLSSGSALIVQDGRVREVRYFQPHFGEIGDSETVISQLGDAVEKSCAEASDLKVPSGLLLSGGIDSSVVAHELKRNIPQLSSFSVGFEPMSGEFFGSGSTFDEFEYARLVASRYALIQHELVLSADTYLDYLPRWYKALGEPLGSHDGVALYALLEEVAKQVKVVFTGSGPDELFDGYRQGALLCAPTAASDQPLSESYYDEMLWLHDARPDLLMPDVAVRSATIAKLNGYLELFGGEIHTAVDAVLAINFLGRGPAYEFRQLDMAASSYGIEARSPLASKRLIKVAFSMSSELRYLEGREKDIFKKALAGRVGEKIAFRKKLGFPIPMQILFTPRFEGMIDEALSPESTLMQLGFLDSKYLAWCRQQPPKHFRNMFYRLVVLNLVVSSQKQFVS